MNYTPVANFQEPVSGVTPTPSFTPLLDQVGQDAICAVGLTKLRSAYTGYCMEVQRVSDNATTNIGFDANGFFDTGSLLTFVGSSEAYVRIWYDQSGNGNNLFNTGSITDMPLIYDSSEGFPTDAAGNISLSSVNPPSSTSTVGDGYLDSSPMTLRKTPTISFFGQINVFNNIGIAQTELDNGYNIGTYGNLIDRLTLIESNGSNIASKDIESTRTDPFASTVFYYVQNVSHTDAKWWITSYQNLANFEDSFNLRDYMYNAYKNFGGFDEVTIFRYYSPALQQNCFINTWIYWDLPDNTTLSSQEIYNLYDWVETNLGYTNNAPTP